MKIMLDDTELQHTDSATYLGITFVKRQTWKTHISRAGAKVSRKLPLLRKLAGTQWGAGETVLRNVYCCFQYTYIGEFIVQKNISFIMTHKHCYI